MAAAELPEMPNGPILELHGQRKRFHVPHGLKPLLEEMTREILRYQPDDIYVFLAKYVDVKLSKRHESSPVQKLSRKSWNNPDAPNILTDEEIEEFLQDMDISMDTANRHATKIQAAFRGHQARKSLDAHGKKLHKDHRKSWEWKRWSWEGPSVLSEEQLDEMVEEYNVTLPVANKYATKIQATWRGHKVRKSVEISRRSVPSADEKSEETPPTDEVDKKTSPSNDASKSSVNKNIQEKDSKIAESKSKVLASVKTAASIKFSGSTMQVAVEDNNTKTEGDTSASEMEDTEGAEADFTTDEEMIPQASSAGEESFTGDEDEERAQ